MDYAIWLHSVYYKQSNLKRFEMPWYLVVPWFYHHVNKHFAEWGPSSKKRNGPWAWLRNGSTVAPWLPSHRLPSDLATQWFPGSLAPKWVPCSLLLESAWIDSLAWHTWSLAKLQWPVVRTLTCNIGTLLESDRVEMDERSHRIQCEYSAVWCACVQQCSLSYTLVIYSIWFWLYL